MELNTLPIKGQFKVSLLFSVLSRGEHFGTRRLQKSAQLGLPMVDPDMGVSKPGWAFMSRIGASGQTALPKLDIEVIWLWVKNRRPKWNPGERNQGFKPAVHILVV